MDAPILHNLECVTTLTNTIVCTTTHWQKKSTDSSCWQKGEKNCFDIILRSVWKIVYKFVNIFVILVNLINTWCKVRCALAKCLIIECVFKYVVGECDVQMMCISQWIIFVLLYMYCIHYVPMHSYSDSSGVEKT